MRATRFFWALGLAGLVLFAASGPSELGTRARASGQAGGQSVTGLEAPPIQLPPGVPGKVEAVLRFIDQNGKAPSHFVGGRVFTNDGRGGEQVLPRVDVDGDAVEYQEWDVNRHIMMINRGPERLVTGSDGSAYYSGDHYQTFIAIRGVAPADPSALEATLARSSDLPPLASLSPSVTAKVDSVLAYIHVHGSAMPGYVGGRDYHNRSQGRGQVLPRIDADGEAISYQEWDVNPRVPGKNRGTERLITDSDGSAYYTHDHYNTFQRIR